MGVVNVTPDSFSDGGRSSIATSPSRMRARWIDEGADILDIGGESTRPGAEPVPLEEERRACCRSSKRSRPAVCRSRSIRVKPARHARGDRRRASADQRHRCAAGAGRARRGRALAIAAVCLMHKQGEPRTMQRIRTTTTWLREVQRFLSATRRSLRGAASSASAS